MIFREGKDLFAVRSPGGEINREFDREGLREYLQAIVLNDKRLWSDDQIEDVLTMDVGDNTPAPKGVYQ